MTVEIIKNDKAGVVDTQVHRTFFLDDVFIIDSTSEEVEPQTLPRVDAIPSPPVAPRRTWSQRVSGVLRAARAALAAVRDAVGWLGNGVARVVQRRAYTGRHHITKPSSHRVQRTPLGRERSTAEFTSTVQRRSREPRTEEGDLAFKHGDTFVSWIALTIESMQHLDYARKHEPQHGRWLCS